MEPKKEQASKSNKDSLQYLHEQLQSDTYQYLAILPTQARRLLVDPRGFDDTLDKLFIENLRKMSVIYEALQNSLIGVDERNDATYPTLQEITRHIAIHKRSVSDRTPIYTEGELLQYLTVLASQKTPFLHILRKMERTKEGELTFQTKFIAPTDDRKERVIIGYSMILNNANAILKNMMHKELEETYLTSLKQTLSSVAPEIRTGRIDYELRKMYITEQMIGPDSKKYLNHVHTVNQIINQKIYQPLILNGIKNKVLLTFNCSDIRAFDKEKLKKFYDIVHFSNSSYIEKRLKLLIEFFNESFFRDWWDNGKDAIFKHSREVKEITTTQYYKEMAQVVITKLSTNAQAAPEHLIHLSLEVLKLLEWLEGNVNQREINTRLNLSKTLSTYLLEIGKILLLKDKKIQTHFQEIIIPALKGEVPNVLACTYPYIPPSKIDYKFTPFSSSRNVYILLKDKKCTSTSIDIAINLFEKNDDPILLRVLENLFDIHNQKKEELKSYIPTFHLERLLEAIKESYKKEMPWWQRVLNSLIGKDLDKHEIQRIKESLLLKEKESQKEVFINKRNSKKDLTVEANRQIALDELKLLERACEYLNSQWKVYKTPTRLELLKFAESESELMIRILNFVNLGASSTRSIVRINIADSDDVYISRHYAIENKISLLEFFTKRMKEEETFKIDNKIFLSQNLQKKNYYLGILNALKQINP